MVDKNQQQNTIPLSFNRITQQFIADYGVFLLQKVHTIHLRQQKTAYVRSIFLQLNMRIFQMTKLKQALLFTTLLTAGIANAELSVETFKPGKDSIFPVSSSLIIGDDEVLLVDAQFQRNDAQALVEKIKATGKPLKTVYISHKDPDFYFGLDVVKTAFPDAKVVATPKTVEGIKNSIIGKYSYWGPILKDNAPQMLVIPEALKGNTLNVSGETIEIKNLDNDPKHTYLWLPKEKIVLGGVIVFDNMHLWLADTPTPQSRATWVKTLDGIKALNPSTVVPGHYVGGLSKGVQSVDFAKNYLLKVEQANQQTQNSAELIKAMKAAYPNLAAEAVLELGAPVVKGEKEWK